MKRGDVVLVALPGDYGKPRPALIVQVDALTADDCGSIVVCPLTTHLTGAASFRIAPTEVNGLRARSEIMVEKLAGVARARLRKVAAITSASLAHRPRQTSAPAPSSTQMWVSLSETSKPP